jgi:hypothetical protein
MMVSIFYAKNIIHMRFKKARTSVISHRCINVLKVNTKIVRVHDGKAFVKFDFDYDIIYYMLCACVCVFVGGGGGRENDWPIKKSL